MTRAEELRAYLAQGSLIAARWEAQDAIVPVPVPSPPPSPPPPVVTVQKKRLILAGWYGNTIPTPTFIRANWTFLKDQPFDGQAVYLRDPAAMYLTQDIQKPVSVPIDTMRRVLAPMKGLPGSHFALVQGSSPPDFFDPLWSVVVENWRKLAVACLENGLTGIMFDNEQYHKPWGNYVDAMGRSLGEYQAQARLRGREVMASVVKSYPKISVIHLHGPSVSRNDAPRPYFPTWAAANELLGPYFEGQLAAANGTAKIIDGGELYSLRTSQQFQATADWRRTAWPGMGISFGVTDRPFQTVPMDATILKTTISNALAAADEYVWFYPELATPLFPFTQGGMAPEWIYALKSARG